MALPNYFKYQQGATPLTWKSSGGTYALTPTSVTDGNGRQGAKGDMGNTGGSDGTTRARLWDVLFTSSVGVAATAGKEIELWWSPSDSATAGTDNAAGDVVSGTDATFNTTPDEHTKQLVQIGSLILSNNTGTAIQRQWFTFSPPQRYGSPVIVNHSGQTLGATATDHTLTFIPREEDIQAAV
jgi:hypothetical protein